MELLITVGAVVVGILLLALVLKALWRVAEPNEALIISGFRARSSPGDSADSMGFKIVTGKGTLVLPGFQAARRLSLDTRGANLQVSCVTKQGIPVAVRGVVIYKVGDDFVSIANAARRFLDQQNTMNDTIHELFAGHLRSICGGLTIEDMIHNREALTGEVRRSSADEMSKLGLVIDSLQIQEIDDASGYITNLGKPHAAAIAAAARIAEAQRDQEATEAEQVAEAKKAAAIRASRIQQAGYQAEIDQSLARAQQAGPLSEAAPSRRSSSSRRRSPSSRHSVRSSGCRPPSASLRTPRPTSRSRCRRPSATPASPKPRPTPRRSSCRPRERRAGPGRGGGGDALAENQDAVIGQQLAEQWPYMVEALAQAMSEGAAGLQMARNLLGNAATDPTTNGDAPPPRRRAAKV